MRAGKNFRAMSLLPPWDDGNAKRDGRCYVVFCCASINAAVVYRRVRLC
jgi:hypothetical protein